MSNRKFWFTVRSHSFCGGPAGSPSAASGVDAALHRFILVASDGQEKRVEGDFACVADISKAISLSLAREANVVWVGTPQLPKLFLATGTALAPQDAVEFVIGGRYSAEDVTLTGAYHSRRLALVAEFIPAPRSCCLAEIRDSARFPLRARPQSAPHGARRPAPPSSLANHIYPRPETSADGHLSRGEAEEEARRPLSSMSGRVDFSPSTIFSSSLSQWLQPSQAQVSHLRTPVRPALVHSCSQPHRHGAVRAHAFAATGDNVTVGDDEPRSLVVNKSSAESTPPAGNDALHMPCTVEILRRSSSDMSNQKTCPESDDKIITSIALASLPLSTVHTEGTVFDALVSALHSLCVPFAVRPFAILFFDSEFNEFTLLTRHSTAAATRQGSPLRFKVLTITADNAASPATESSRSALPLATGHRTQMPGDDDDVADREEAAKQSAAIPEHPMSAKELRFPVADKVRRPASASVARTPDCLLSHNTVATGLQQDSGVAYHSIDSFSSRTAYSEVWSPAHNDFHKRRLESLGSATAMDLLYERWNEQAASVEMFMAVRAARQRVLNNERLRQVNHAASIEPSSRALAGILRVRHRLEEPAAESCPAGSTPRDDNIVGGVIIPHGVVKETVEYFVQGNPLFNQTLVSESELAERMKWVVGRVVELQRRMAAVDYTKIRQLEEQERAAEEANKRRMAQEEQQRLREAAEAEERERRRNDEGAHERFMRELQLQEHHRRAAEAMHMQKQREMEELRVAAESSERHRRVAAERLRVSTAMIEARRLREREMDRQRQEAAANEKRRREEEHARLQAVIAQAEMRLLCQDVDELETCQRQSLLVEEANAFSAVTSEQRREAGAFAAQQLQLRAAAAEALRDAAELVLAAKLEKMTRSAPPESAPRPFLVPHQPAAQEDLPQHIQVQMALRDLDRRDDKQTHSEVLPTAIVAVAASTAEVQSVSPGSPQRDGIRQKFTRVVDDDELSFEIDASPKSYNSEFIVEDDLVEDDEESAAASAGPREAPASDAVATNVYKPLAAAAVSRYLASRGISTAAAR